MIEVEKSAHHSVAQETSRSGYPSHGHAPEYPLHEGVRVGSLASPADRQEAIKIMEHDGVWGGRLGGVYGLWCNAASKEAIYHAQAAKGDPDARKTYSTMLDTSILFDIVDREALHPDVRHLFVPGNTPTETKKNIAAFLHRYGLVGFVRVPIDAKRAAAYGIPEAITSIEDNQMLLHHLDPFGHGYMTRLLREAREAGIPFIAVTSMNETGQEPSITKSDRAKEFSRQHDIPLLLEDPYRASPVVSTQEANGITVTPDGQGTVTDGSYSIVDLRFGYVMREGPEDISVNEQLLGMRLQHGDIFLPNGKQVQTAKRQYTGVDFSYLNDLQLSPQLLRAAFILANKGYSPAAIRTRMKNTIKSLSHLEKAA
jgi:tRNA A37 threonylcarbamoyladenosine synthetase subunit TsaC/SUA5/YrdC